MFIDRVRVHGERGATFSQRSARYRFRRIAQPGATGFRAGSARRKNLAANDLEKAQALFEQAIQNNPKDARAHLDLGIALEMRDDLESAERAYRAAIAIQPNFAEALNNLGVLLRLRASSKSRFPPCARRYNSIEAPRRGI